MAELGSKGMKKSFVGCLAVLLLVGCHGGMDTDPLKDQPTNVRKGVPPNEKPKEDLNPVPRDAMRLELEPEIANFVEGKEGQITIKADILGFESEEFVLSIKNLPEGADFDPATGKITWTPVTDMVIGNDYMETYQLIVQMSTVKTPILSIVRKFPIFVQRDAIRPEIINVHMPTNEVMEGTDAKFTVQVRDLDSSDGGLHRFREPHLTVVQTDNTPRDGSSLVRLVPSTRDNPNPHRLDPNDPTFDPNLWIYTLTIDARGKELTSSRDNFKFGLIATSRFGLPSAEGGVPSKPKPLSIAIITKVPKPLTTWPDKVIFFKANQETIFSFDMYAPFGALAYNSTPEGDGILDKPDIKEKCNESLPGTATCTCVKEKSWRFHCTMTWTPGDPDPDVDKYPVAFSVINRNGFRRSNSARGEFLKYVKIVP